jgi:hypothetical protein
MSLQVRKIILYGLDGDLRELEFRLGALNILTGASKTGKSAIVDIIDYCTGRSECFIAEGIQRRVSWFGVLFQDSEAQIFVARKSPSGTARTSSDIYIEQGGDFPLPGMDRIVKNTTVDAVVARLSRAVGIQENRHVAHSNQTRVPLEANIRHALILCIQDQNDIDNRNYLFHRQSETFTAVDIRHTLPYFLGAIDEDRLLMQAQLDGARRELRRHESRQRAMESLDSEETPRAELLLAEAARVGLATSSTDEGSTSTVDALRAVLNNDFADAADSLGSASEQIEALRSDRRSLRAELSAIRFAVREARLFALDRSGYEREAREHQSRLSSIGLFRTTDGDSHVCPLCTSVLPTPMPTVNELRESLERLNSQLRFAEAENPRIQEYLIEMLERERVLIEELRTNHEAIDRLIIEDELLDQQQNEAIAQARVLGRISEFLDVRSVNESSTDIDRQLDDTRRRVNLLESELDPDVVQENADTFLGFVSDYLTEYAQELNLEYSENRVRIDIRRLTIVANTITGPVTLDRMGSGENWVGYHVAAHLALHRWFRIRTRPVPGFLILDQPSQAHFPPEIDTGGSVEQLRDEDKAAVQTLFQLIYDVANALAPDLQVIVLDHARIDEPWFTDSIVEEWRSDTGLKLVPLDWMPEDERGWPDYRHVTEP